MKFLSICLSATILSSSIVLFLSPNCDSMNQSLSLFTTSQNNEAPHSNDGGSRFYEPLYSNTESIAIIDFEVMPPKFPNGGGKFDRVYAELII